MTKNADPSGVRSIFAIILYFFLLPLAVHGLIMMLLWVLCDEATRFLSAYLGAMFIFLGWPVAICYLIYFLALFRSLSGRRPALNRKTLFLIGLAVPVPALLITPCFLYWR